jgi:alpha-N-arabinofuranosidase
MTEPGGGAWRQTIFHPFSQAAQFGHGEVLRTRIRTESYSTATHPRLDFLLASVLHDAVTGRCAVFALNRSPTDEMELRVEFRGLGRRRLVVASQLHHGDLKATNTSSAPETIAPSDHEAAEVVGDRLRATLLPLSWNVFVTEAQPHNTQPDDKGRWGEMHLPP